MKAALKATRSEEPAMVDGNGGGNSAQRDYHQQFFSLPGSGFPPQRAPDLTTAAGAP